jgi:phosphoribosylformylglycinamidine (FGAM) synthase-like enzyme
MIRTLTTTNLKGNFKMNATYTAYVASDLYEAGTACDGHPFIAEKYYVLIENAAGTRFRHEKSFAGAEVVECEETGEVNFADIRETAKAIVEDLAAKVNAALASGKALTSSCWFEVDPVYGSDAYYYQGTELKRLFDEKLAA